MNNYVFFFCLLVSISLTSPTQIHILDLSQKKRKLVGDVAGNPNSTFTKVCEKVIGSYNFVGRNGLDIYKYCKNDHFELLGKNNTLIRQNSPFCFNNLDAFFCRYQVTDIKRKRNLYKPRTCADKNALKLVLSIIQGCIKEELTEAPNSKRFSTCPSLNINTYKIIDKNAFCDGAQKKTVEKGRDRTTIEYQQITEQFKSNCRRVVGMYNACIDGDNILFPHSNYRKCFSEFNSLYVCSHIKKYSKREKDVCSNFVLPTLAYVNQKKSIYGKAPKFYCEGFESHVIKHYNKYINVLGEQEEELDHRIEFIDKVKKNNRLLKKLSEGLLSELIEFNRIWSKFYPMFVETYRKRERLYQEEFVILEKMRTAFDKFYPYTAHLNSLIQDKTFLAANFSDLFDSIKAYYNKANDNIQELDKIIESYQQLLEKENREFLRKKKESEERQRKRMLEKKALRLKRSNAAKVNKLGKISPAATKKTNKVAAKKNILPKVSSLVSLKQDSKLMISQSIRKDEIFAFQNQYVSIQIYLKSFLNFVMKKIRDTDERNERLKFRLVAKMNILKARIGFINSQKQKLFEYMLE